MTSHLTPWSTMTVLLVVMANMGKGAGWSPKVRIILVEVGPTSVVSISA